MINALVEPLCDILKVRRQVLHCRPSDLLDDSLKIFRMKKLALFVIVPAIGARENLLAGQPSRARRLHGRSRSVIGADLKGAWLTRILGAAQSMHARFAPGERHAQVQIVTGSALDQLSQFAVREGHSRAP